MDRAPKPAVRSTTLTVTGSAGQKTELTAEQIQAMPHKTVEVFNEHAKTKESYSGVPLTEILKQLGTPTGSQVHGKVYTLGILAEGTDHYKVLYSIGEIDSANHNGDVIVADQIDGKPLENDGAFKLVSTEDKHPARWVRNLTAITVKAVE